MATEATLRKNVANWLVQYIGIKEGSDEHKAILKVFNDSKLCTRYTMTTSDAWCATAASAAFIACGLSSIFPCVECSCSRMITLAKSAGIWVEDDSYTPGIGDCILYDWQDSGSGDNTGTPDHVGIVTKVSGSTITVIEGNKSDTVGYRTISVNGKYIRGFITPNFASKATSTDTSSSSSSTGTSSSSTTTTEKKATDAAKSYLKSLAGTYKVTASALNVRNGAGTGKSIMCTIPKGTTVQCYGYYTTVSGTKWLYIQFTYNGVKYTGFASSKYLSK